MSAENCCSSASTSAAPPPRNSPPPLPQQFHTKIVKPKFLHRPAVCAARTVSVQQYGRHHWRSGNLDRLAQGRLTPDRLAKGHLAAQDRLAHLAAQDRLAHQIDWREEQQQQRFRSMPNAAGKERFVPYSPSPNGPDGPRPRSKPLRMAVSSSFLPLPTVQRSAEHKLLEELQRQKPEEIVIRRLVTEVKEAGGEAGKRGEEEEKLLCKICGQSYDTFKTLRHHLVWYHQIKQDLNDLGCWFERHTKPKPDPSLQPRNGRPSKQPTIRFVPASTYMEQKAPRNQMLSKHVICSICQRGLFQDSMREHLKGVHGMEEVDSFTVAKYIAKEVTAQDGEVEVIGEDVPELEAEIEIGEGMRVPGEGEEVKEEEEEMKPPEVVELAGEEAEEVEKQEEANNKMKVEGKEPSPSPSPPTSRARAPARMSSQTRKVRLFICAFCKKTLRRDSFREHLRLQHEVLTASLKAAQKHVYDEMEVEESASQSHRRYNLPTEQEMYKDCLKDPKGHIYCMLCNDSVFPGALRSHLTALHQIATSRTSAKDAVDQYSIKTGSAGECSEGLDQLMETDPPLLTRMEPDEKEFEQFLSTEPLDLFEGPASSGQSRVADDEEE